MTKRQRLLATSGLQDLQRTRQRLQEVRFTVSLSQACLAAARGVRLDYKDIEKIRKKLRIPRNWKHSLSETEVRRVFEAVYQLIADRHCR